MKQLLGLFAIIGVLGSASALTSCSSDEEDLDKALKDTETSIPVEDIFEEARKEMANKNYIRSVELFEEVERLYPFSELAPKARVMTAYSYYKDEEYDKAVDTIENFISLNPGSKEVPFMYYLKAISYYDRIKDIRRDQEVTRKAKVAFEDILRRFPNSAYAREAKYKLDLIRDHLAGKEMEVGRFYLKRKDYLAAINRFKEVLKEYDDTVQVEEALYRLVETNKILGINSESVKYAGILGYNYPSSKWYKRAYSLVNNGNTGDKKEGMLESMFSFGDNEDDEDLKAPELHPEGDSIKVDQLMQKEVE